MSNSESMSPAELYETFYGPAIFSPLAERLVARAAPDEGDHVLDVACGTGILTRRIAPLVGPSGRVVGMDINPAMLAVARSLPSSGTPIEWREADATQAELPAGVFDLVVCQQGLQFFADRPGALARLRAALKPGGRIALAVWQGIEHQPLSSAFAEVESRYLGPLGVTYAELVAPFSLGDAGELRALLEGAGFSSVDVAPYAFEAQFPSADSFVRKMETAYGAVIPAFVEDAAAFGAFVDAVERETRDIVQRYSLDGSVRFPMPTHFATARA